MIPNGIDVKHFYQPDGREEKRNTLGIRSDTFVIGNIARMVPLKNHRFLMNVFRELIALCPEVKLLLVGDGPLRMELESYANHMGLSRSIVFLGERKDTAELLSTFDVFVLPSLAEAMGIVLMEAMASGIPVVASKTGGIPEVVENGKTGLLVELNTIKWVETIRRIIEGDLRTRDMTEGARFAANERFSVETMIENYEKAYSS